MQQKQYDYHRNCNLPQSNPALSPGRFRPYAFLTAPLSACMLQSLLFPTHMAVRLSAGFLQIGLTVYFQQKRFYRIVRTAEGQLPDSDNIASGPYHFHSVHKRILLFPVLLAIPGGKRQLPDTGMLQFGFALIGMAVAGQDEFKDFSRPECFRLGADTTDHFFYILCRKHADLHRRAGTHLPSCHGPYRRQSNPTGFLETDYVIVSAERKILLLPVYKRSP